MTISIIGAGCGNETLTAGALKALEEAELLIGSERILDGIYTFAKKKYAVYTDDIVNAIEESDCRNICILFSGDSGFYSGARLLLPKLERYEPVVYPGISSLQYFAAKLEEPWQDWKLVSAHGVECDIAYEMCAGNPVFVLTDNVNKPEAICHTLCVAGLEYLNVAIGENLGTGYEKITRGTPMELRKKQYAALSVMLIDAAPVKEYGFLIPDWEFERYDKVPMTKQEIRAVVLSKLEPKKTDICWDIGTGTGSVAIELSRHCRGVWSVEHDSHAHQLAKINRENLCAWNLRLLYNRAPAPFCRMPKPDAVFIGGSDGALGEILENIKKINENARICISAISLETLHEAVTELESLGYRTEISEVSVNSSKNTSKHHLMLPKTSVYIISGNIL